MDQGNVMHHNTTFSDSDSSHSYYPVDLRYGDELEVRQCLEYACGNVEGNIVGRSE
jgi:hypothetical protein